MGRLAARPSPRLCAHGARRAKLVAASAAALAIALSATAVLAVPLPAPSVGPGVRYFGYWGSAAEGVGEPDPGCQSNKWTGYTNCIKDHANVTHITFGIGQEDWAIARLQEAADLKMGVVLTVWNYFFKPRSDDNRKLDLVDGYQDKWAKFLSRIDDAYIKRSHTIIGFYIYDEPAVDAQTMANIGTVAKLLAQTAPDVHRWVTFTAYDIDQAAFTIPAGVDWISYDCYGVDGASPSFAHCAPTYQGYEYKSVSYYTARLKELIKKTPNYHPGLVLIPQGFLPSGSADLQADLLARLAPEIAMAEGDPDYVMIMPFLWQAVTSLPSVKRYLRAEGSRITGGSSDDPIENAVSSNPSASIEGLAAYLWLRPPCRFQLRLLDAPPPMRLRPPFSVAATAAYRGAALTSTCPRGGRELENTDACSVADTCRLRLPMSVVPIRSSRND
jgi:hypothetical protein